MASGLVSYIVAGSALERRYTLLSNCPRGHIHHLGLPLTLRVNNLLSPRRANYVQLGKVWHYQDAGCSIVLELVDAKQACQS